jgi:hypothetical protein
VTGVYTLSCGVETVRKKGPCSLRKIRMSTVSTDISWRPCILVSGSLSMLPLTLPCICISSEPDLLYLHRFDMQQAKAAADEQKGKKMADIKDQAEIMLASGELVAPTGQKKGVSQKIKALLSSH